jgi:carboxypeptidase Taq
MATHEQEGEGKEESEAPDAYEGLLGEYRRISNIGHAQSVLNWDQEVMMPEGGTPARSQQLSTLSGLSHELLVEGEVGDHLDALEDAELTDERAAAVREVRREHDRNASVPTALVEEISGTTSEALPTWKEAKAEDDFSTFAPVLEDLLDLKREYAAHIDDSRDPYAVLFEDYEPYLGLDAAERVLGRLGEELPDLIDAVRESDADLADPFADGTFDTDTQEAVSRDILDTLGYDWDRGRLDTAPHPFSTGNVYDARVTTRFDEAEPLDAITATIHEFGHAQYTLGLPEDAYGTPLGEARDLTVHESQSRFWENHVGRTQAFWETFGPTLTDRFGIEATPREIYQAANRVDPSNLIRVEADELTYHLHIVLRFEIERDLIQGDLDVSEVPAVWNDKMDEYLGIRPDTDTEGCLQDIHWSHGSFGYFPTYSMGSILAAQLEAAVRRDLDVDGLVREGDFDPIREWLREHVHRHGARYRTDDLVEEATGESYTADYFLDYANAKYGSLYDL